MGVHPDAGAKLRDDFATEYGAKVATLFAKSSLRECHHRDQFHASPNTEICKRPVKNAAKAVLYGIYACQTSFQPLLNAWATCKSIGVVILKAIGSPSTRNTASPSRC